MHMFRWRLALLTYSAIKRSGSGPFFLRLSKRSSAAHFFCTDWRCKLCRLQVVYYCMLLHYQTVTHYRSLFLRLSPFIAASRDPKIATLPKHALLLVIELHLCKCFCLEFQDKNERIVIVSCCVDWLQYVTPHKNACSLRTQLETSDIQSVFLSLFLSLASIFIAPHDSL